MTKAVPYFPLYAANFIASRPYKLMTLQQRGLWISIYMECWVNGSLPADINEMAKLLGFPVNEVEQAMSQLHYSFLEKSDGQLISKELEEYRHAFLEKREKQRLGGIQGAANKKARQAARLPKGQPEGSLNHINSNSINSNQLVKRSNSKSEIDEWLKNYDDSPDAPIHYLRASRG